MTLCIAAKCSYQDENAIIMSSDWRIEDDASGSQTALKQGCLAPGWWFMYAGIQARAVELVISIKDYLKDHPLGPGAISLTIRESLRKHREKMADELIHSQIARSYQWLLEEGHSVLPSDYCSQLIRYVADIRLEAQLIVCGFCDNDPVIFLIDETRGAPIAGPIENFAAIGSGSLIALSVLHQREHQSTVPFRRALYHVYEAKRLGEAAPGVGKQTTVTVLLVGGKVGRPNESASFFVQQCYDRYAPKDLEGKEDWEASPESLISVSPGPAIPQETKHGRRSRKTSRV